MEQIEVCMPTSETGGVLEETLHHLHAAACEGGLTIAVLRIADDNSDDDTELIAKEVSEEFEWELDFQSASSNLPEARQSLINRVKTDWFLFLDDDVRISSDYFVAMAACVAPGIGAIQGRKAEKIDAETGTGDIVTDVVDNPTDWVRKRSFRGGTHATLVRSKACQDIVFPNDLVVWEDEYLRREIESNGYIWLFNHQAVFEHNSLQRHPPGWTEGYLQGKYDLRPFWHVLLNIPYAILTGKSPVGYLKMVGGYVYASVTT